MPGDPYFEAADIYSTVGLDVNDFAQVTTQLLSDPDLSMLAPRDEGKSQPFISLPNLGGSRIQAELIVFYLFTGAFRQIFFLGLHEDEATFLRLVVEGLEELKRALRGESVRVYQVIGLSGISLDEDAPITTPWGVIRPARDLSAYPVTNGHLVDRRATAVLAIARLSAIQISLEAEPQVTSDLTAAVERERPSLLLPLAFALATQDSSKVPDVVWQTDLVPFSWSSSWRSNLAYRFSRGEAALSSSDQRAVEEWTRITDERHVPNADIAARRLVQSLLYRLDQADVLIDSVTVWESLVGTSSETTFRVTAALAKMLETQAESRETLRKELADIYSVRSRVVHGDAVEPQVVASAAARAREIAIASLADAYKRGSNWLSLRSTERSNWLILQHQ